MGPQALSQGLVIVRSGQSQPNSWQRGSRLKQTWDAHKIEPGA